MTDEFVEEPLPEVEFYDVEKWVDDPNESSGHAPLVPTVDHGPVEVWLRNANEYINVLKETPYTKFAFSLSDLRVKKFHPYPLLCKALPADLDFEWITLSRGSFLRWKRSDYENQIEPRRIPMWAHGHDPKILVRFCENAERNGYDRIGVGYLPRGNRVEQHRTLEWLYRLAAQHPKIKFHYAFGSTWRHMFGLNFASVDVNPAYPAKHKRVWLPNGDPVSERGWNKRLKWIHVLGYSVADLSSYEGRVRFNIESALWAAENYRNATPISKIQKRQQEDPLGLMATRRRDSELRFAQRSRRPVLRQKLAVPDLNPDDYPQSSPDPNEPYHMVEPVTNAPLIPVKPRGNTDSDKILCNSCSLAPTCRVYREGAICSVSSSPTSRLAAMYGTRDVETIKGALSEVLSKQVERYERSAEKFREDEESDVLDLKRSEHLMKMENSLVRSTETLMKILDPQFRESNIPAINGNVTHIYNPRVLVADVVKQLEESGVDRASLTPEMIQQAIAAQPKVIEA